MPGLRWSGQALDPSCFASMGCSSSVSRQQLDKILSSRDWPSQTPVAEEESLGAWFLLRQTSDEGTWESIGDAWRSAVFPPRSLIKHKDRPEYWMVMTSTKWAVMVWPVVVSGSQQAGYSGEVRCDSGATAGWLSIRSLDGWQCLPWAASPPHAKQQHIGMQVRAERWSPLQWCARAAFLHVPEPIIDLIVKEVGLVPADMPKSRYERCFWLMSHALPGMSDLDIGLLLASALGAAPDDLSLIGQSGNGSLTEGVLEHSDQKDLKEYEEAVEKRTSLDMAAFNAFLAASGLVDKYPEFKNKLGSALKSMLEKVEVDMAAARAKQPKLAGVTKAPAEEPSAAEPVAPAKKKKTLQLDLGGLRKMLPKRKGCVGQLYEDTRRVQVYFPEVVPASRSRTWSAKPGEGFSRRQVIEHCLLWAWQHETRLFGNPCPWAIAGVPELAPLVPSSSSSSKG